MGTPSGSGSKWDEYATSLGTRPSLVPLVLPWPDPLTYLFGLVNGWGTDGSYTIRSPNPNPIRKVKTWTCLDFGKRGKKGKREGKKGRKRHLPSSFFLFVLIKMKEGRTLFLLLCLVAYRRRKMGHCEYPEWASPFHSTKSKNFSSYFCVQQLLQQQPATFYCC